jgi:hypothetical protein
MTTQFRNKRGGGYANSAMSRATPPSSNPYARGYARQQPQFNPYAYQPPQPVQQTQQPANPIYPPPPQQSYPSPTMDFLQNTMAPPPAQPVQQTQQPANPIYPPPPQQSYPSPTMDFLQNTMAPPPAQPVTQPPQQSYQPQAPVTQPNSGFFGSMGGNTPSYTPGLSHPGGISTMALVNWYNEKTGQRYTAGGGGYEAEPGSGWRIVKSDSYDGQGKLVSQDPINMPGFVGPTYSGPTYAPAYSKLSPTPLAQNSQSNSGLFASMGALSPGFNGPYNPNDDNFGHHNLQS